MTTVEKTCHCHPTYHELGVHAPGFTASPAGFCLCPVVDGAKQHRGDCAFGEVVAS